MKGALAGEAFDRPGEVLDAITAFREEIIQAGELKGVFQCWVERVRWVFNHNDDYDHEQTSR
jgi:hypothetical protein